MNIPHKLTMELTQNCSSNIIYAVQGDSSSRTVELTFLANGIPWIIPEDITALIRYSKSDGKGGVYDTLPDETPAWTASENVMTLMLAPQILTAPGTVRLAVTFMRGSAQVSTFTIIICVEAAVSADDASEDYFHVPGLLPAPVSAETGQYLQITSVDSYGHVTALKGVTAEKQIPNAVEPNEEDIPKVFFGAVLPQTKDDTIMSFRYISKTEEISGYCKTKAQGNSSMSYPKKNQTVKLYKDAECTEKLKVDFKGWGKQNKFCFKANWIDLTHARNIVSARLWGDVVKSRANYEAIPELLRTSPNQGAVDGFPVKVYAGGIYQGRYTINIPKDAWMANMDKDLDNHCILCGENYVSGCFRAEAKIDESDWTDEIHETVPDSIKTRWNEAIRFVMNSTDEEFVSGIGNYFDIDSLIDYYLFGLITCNNDGFGKNQLYHTYDGMKWYATVYDMDNTFGTYLGYKLADNFSRTNYEDYKNGGGNLLYMRLEELFMDAIKARYLELKKGALSIENIINRFEHFTDITPPYLVEEDYAETTADGAYVEIPLREESNIQQIRYYTLKHYVHVDSYINGLGADSALLYSLPTPVTFYGSAGQGIDTEVMLFDKAKDFTIIVDVENAENYADNTAVFDTTWYQGNYIGGAALYSAYRYSDADSGFNIKGIASDGGASVFEPIYTKERTQIAVVFVAGLPSACYYKKSSDTEIQTNFMYSNFTAVQHEASLMIGTNNNGYEAFNGTIYSLEIYGKAMTATDIFKALIH